RRPEVSEALGHRGQAGPAGTPQQAQQQRLRLVVSRMGHGDRGGLLSLFDTAQEGVALLPGRLLHAPAVALRSAGHIGRALAQGHAQAAAQVTAERRVVPGGGPQAVVEVRPHHPEVNSSDPVYYGWLGAESRASARCYTRPARWNALPAR